MGQYPFCLLGLCLSGVAVEVLGFWETINPYGSIDSKADMVPIPLPCVCIRK